MTRVMLNNKSMPKSFWGEAINTACHTLNRVYFRLDTKKTPYELWREKKPVVKYFRVFGNDCYILWGQENLEKFDAKSDKGFFLGYSTSSRAYRVYNLRTKTMMESANVVINDEQCAEAHAEKVQQVQERSIEVEDTLPKEYVEKSTDEELLILNDTVSEPTTLVRETPQEHDKSSTPARHKSTTTSLVKGPSARVELNHPSTNILGSLNDNMRLRSIALNFITHSCYLS